MRFLTTPDSGKMVLTKQFRPSSGKIVAVCLVSLCISLISAFTVQALPNNTRLNNGTGVVTKVTPQTKFRKDLYFNKGVSKVTESMTA